MAFQFSLAQELMSFDECLLPGNIEEAIKSLLDAADLDSSFADTDSLGSTCPSPGQSTPETLSPAGSPGVLNGFVFPGHKESSSETTKPKIRRSRKPQSDEERQRRKGESKVKRNERERRRVRRLAEGFRKLRKMVPSCGGEDNKKLSKLDTLRNALDYIHDLAALVEEDDARRMQAQVFAQGQSSYNSTLPNQPKADLQVARNDMSGSSEMTFMSDLSPQTFSSSSLLNVSQPWLFMPQHFQQQPLTALQGTHLPPNTANLFPLWFHE